MASRPRRSTASVVSYAIPALELSSSESSSDNSDPAEYAENGADGEDVKPTVGIPNLTAAGKRRGRPPANGVSAKPRPAPKTTAKKDAKGKGKAKAKPRRRRDSSDSGSDFGAELANKSSSSESEDFVDEDAGASDEEGAGARDADFDDDLASDDTRQAGSASRTRSPSSFTPRLGKRPGYRPSLKSNKEAKSKIKMAFLPTGPAPGSSSGSGSGAPRAIAPPAQHRPSRDAELAQFGPLWEPPSRRWNSATEQMEEGKPLLDWERDRIMQGWAETPFFLREGGLADLGWWKGKWNMDAQTIHNRWGGWYGLEEKEIEPIDEGAAAAYFPTNVYPARPARVFADAPLERAQDGSDENTVALEEDDPMEVDGEDDALDDAGASQVKMLLGLVDYDEQHNIVGQEEVTFGRFEARRVDDFVPQKPGHLFNAGGPVTALAWAPRTEGKPEREFIAVGTVSTPVVIAHAPAPSPALIQIWSLDCTSPTDAARCTAEEGRGRGMRLECALCVEVGEPLQLAWCPRGGKFPAVELDGLGLVAGVFTDGSVSLFDVPHPDALSRRRAQKEGEADKPVFVKAAPRLRLALAHTSALCLAWGSHETIAAGCTDGSVVVWDVGHALRSHASTCRPIQLIPVAHVAAIRSISFVLTPPLADDLSPRQDPDAEPTTLFTVGMDGAGHLINLLDPGSIVGLWQERGVGICSAFQAQTGGMVMNDTENSVRASFLLPQAFGSSRVVSMHRGHPWAIAASEHHPFTATTSADGVCVLANAIRALRHKSHRPKFAQKLFKVDFDRLKGQFRMIENLVPEQRATHDVIKGKRKGKDQDKTRFEEVSVSGAWSPEVAVLSAAWCQQPETARLLASGLACGLVRVDWVDRGPD